MSKVERAEAGTYNRSRNHHSPPCQRYSLEVGCESSSCSEGYELVKRERTSGGGSEKDVSIDAIEVESDITVSPSRSREGVRSVIKSSPAIGLEVKSGLQDAGSAGFCFPGVWSMLK